MKKILLLFGFTLLSSLLIAQQSRKRFSDLGDEAMKAHYYQSAIEYYTLVLDHSPNDVHCNYMLAECYRNTFNYGLAEKSYEKVKASNSTSYPLTLFYLALTQKINNKYQQALATFDEFIAFAEKRDFQEKSIFIRQAKLEKDGCNLAIDRSSLPFKSYQLKLLTSPINTEANDFAPSLLSHDTSINITSGRKKSQDKSIDNFGEEITGNFRFVKDGNGWKSPVADDDFEKTNKDQNEGAGSFTLEATKFYFTRCSGSECTIYVSILANGKWQPEVKLNDNINQKESESKQPSLSITGDTLFFVSNRAGGEGMNDIYMSVSSGNDKWGPAKNLGSKINTEFNECSPFYLSHERMLVMASQGHPGYGGFDLFVVKNPFADPIVENVGKPFNSPMDDLYFVTGQSKGYLTSNRPGGVGKFDIYSFDMVSENAVIASLNKGDSLENSNASHLVASNSEPESVSINTNSNSINGSGGNIQAGQNNPAKRNDLTNNSKTAGGTNKLATNGNEVGQVNTFNMKGNKSLSVSGTLIDGISDKPIESMEVQLVNEKGEVVKVTTSNGEGQFRYTNIPMDQKYTVVVKEKKSTVYNSQKLNIKDLKVEGFEESSVSSKFENIYFDFAQFALRPEAIKTLDVLSELCKSNPNLQIEIDAYTDFIGNDEYNDGLSKKRGEVTMNYLLQKGVDRTSLVVVAKGKNNPIASNETLGGRQLNRRIEFNVKGYDLKAVASTYIIEPKMTLFSISKKYNTTVGVLKRLNGLTSNHIEANRPLRVPILTSTPSEPQAIKKNGKMNEAAPNILPTGLYHAVKKGETVFSIAVKNNMTVERLMELNEISDKLIIKSGQKLKVEPRPSF